MKAADRKARAEALRRAICAMAQRYGDSTLRFGLAKLGTDQESAHYRAMNRQLAAIKWLAEALAGLSGGAR